MNHLIFYDYRAMCLWYISWQELKEFERSQVGFTSLRKEGRLPGDGEERNDDD